jgi:hypothetical protein
MDKSDEIIQLLTEIRDLLKGKPKATAQTQDQAWLDALCQDETYKGIDVRREYGKALNWCQTNNRQCTRKFFINWLNKVERPVQVQVKVPVQAPPVYTKQVPERAKGVPPPPDVAEKLSRLLGSQWGRM